MRKPLASAGRRFVFAVIAVAVVSALLLMLDSAYWNPLSDNREMRMFQRALGGLGMGAAGTPAWNIFYYDPRLQSVDDSNMWPIAGSYPYSPSSASTVAAFRELPRNDLTIKVGR